MKKSSFLCVVGACVLLAACAGREREGAGTVLGGVGGAIIGSTIGSGTGRLVATAAGAVLGAWAGNEIGKSLDRADRLEQERAAQRSLENNRVGQSTYWRNPDSGNSGAVTPTRTYQAASGEHCREYQTTVNVGGEEQEAYGTACRQADGSWKVVS